MPLHLLGKKSWNVYNKDAIAKVRRDEAAAALREKEEQRQLYEADADSRLQVLRDVRDRTQSVGQPVDGDDRLESQTQRRSKKRKLDGEDDTDRDIRLAQQAGTTYTPRLALTSGKGRDVPLTDKHGHINLFPEDSARQAKGNAEVAAESAKQQADFEDQYTMKFANAAGRHVDSAKPWYGGTQEENQLRTSNDLRSREREQKRMDANDPLAAIKKGVKQLREADRHREEWRTQRERDLNEVEELARAHKHRAKRRHSAVESLDNFNLDEGYNRDRSDRQKRKRSTEGHRRHDKERSRSHRDPRTHS